MRQAAATEGEHKACWRADAGVQQLTQAQRKSCAGYKQAGRCQDKSGKAAVHSGEEVVTRFLPAASTTARSSSRAHHSTTQQGSLLDNCAKVDNQNPPRAPPAPWGPESAALPRPPRPLLPLLPPMRLGLGAATTGVPALLLLLPCAPAAPAPLPVLLLAAGPCSLLGDFRLRAAAAPPAAAGAAPDLQSDTQHIKGLAKIEQ